MIPAQTLLPFPSRVSPLGGRPALPINFHRASPQALGRRLAQSSAGLDRAMFYGAGLLNLAFLGATAWVGFTVATEKRGLQSVAGWVVGVGSILAGLYSLGVMGVETVKRPTETALVPAAPGVSQ